MGGTFYNNIMYMIMVCIYVCVCRFQECHLHKLPPVLTFALLRFLFDFGRGERYKVSILIHTCTYTVVKAQMIVHEFLKGKLIQK